MSFTVAVLKETAEGERRVALDPASANKLAGKGVRILVESGAGDDAGFTDEQYSKATTLDDAENMLTMSDVWMWVQPPDAGRLSLMADNSVGMGMVFAHRHPQLADAFNDRSVSCLAMELVPRISRAQSMDVLSSQAAVAGYNTVLRAATLAPRLIPMLTTAAGTREIPGAGALRPMTRCAVAITVVLWYNTYTL